MKNLYIQLRQSSKAITLVMLTIFFAFSANAQTIDAINTSPPAVTYYMQDDTDASVDYATSGTFDAGTIFYLHTGASGTSFEEDDVLVQGTGTGANSVLNFTWTEFGFNSYYLSAATGSFEFTETDFETNASVVGGSVDNGDNYYGGSEYNMDGAGLRRITTQSLDLSSSDQIILNVRFNDANVVEDRPIVVQFSTDGSDYTDMTDDQAENEWFATGDRDLRFVLTSGMKSTTTSFRILQESSNSLITNEEEWAISAGTADFDVQIGGLTVVDDFFVGNFTVNRPSTAITSFLDSDDNPVGLYYPGQSIKIEGSFTGATDQVDEYNYTAVFRDGDDRFTLGSIVEANDGTSIITVTGTIPTDVEYDENWDVSLEAHTTASAVFGIEEEFSSDDTNLDDLTILGGTQDSDSDPIEFEDDGDRYALTPELDIQTIDNSSVSFDLAKLSANLAPSGTEIVLEYTTDGTTFTQIGDAVDLNGDLTESIMISPLVAGAVSSTTQFRIKQLSNNGEGLSTWSLDDLEIVTGGNVLTNNDLIDYTSSSIDIDAPVVVLDAVNVPSDLIYPGSSVDITYNITSGVFPDDTEFDVVLDNGVFTFIVGTATDITPGDDEDHTASITVPAIVGGSYDLKMIASGSAVESNTVTIPVYNTSISITEITSDSDTQVGGEDVIFPGSEITVSYTVDGDIGSGAELMLEVRDYDKEVSDNDGYELVSTETGLDGAIVGTLPTGINFDDNGSENPFVRIKVGNGVLAEAAIEFVDDVNGDDISSYTYSDLVIDLDATEGNKPSDEDVFIGSGDRSATTLPFDMALGGSVDLNMVHFSDYNGTPQDIYLQASTDGETWTDLDDQEYSGGNISFSEDVPQSLRSATTRFRVIYNMDGEAAEFENQMRFNNITLRSSSLTAANTDEEDISSQFIKPTVSLETLDSYAFATGETFTIEYTTSGPFPSNTAFAIVLAGPDNLETVIGESSDLGTASVEVTMPAFAFEDNPLDTDALYNELKVIAFNKATTETTYTPDETIVIDEDDSFITIEGTDDSDGSYTFDETGDRSLLTQAYDLTEADNVTLNFTFSDVGIDATDNLLTIPVLQVSTDAGVSFQNVAAEEDGMLGDGYLYNNTNYSAELPSSAITSATHFRWYQALNLGDDANVWTVSAISIVLEKGNEITTYYATENSEVASTLAHPDLDGYEWEQVNADTEAVFNGEDFTYSWNQIFETSDDFPSGTQFDFILHDGTNFVIDPETNRPVVIATTTALGDALTASVPFYVEEGSYSVRLIASIPWEDDVTYFYAGDENGESTETVGSLDVFLRAVRTVFDFDANDVFYAGNSATFTIELENTDENDLDVTALYANLLVKEYGDDDEDLVLATQQGIADITVDLPPYIRGNYDFQVELSEGGPLGEVGDLLGAGDLENLQDDISNQFINAPETYTEVTTRDYYESQLGYNTNERMYYTFDYVPANTLGFRLYYSLNGGAEVFVQNWGSSEREGQSTSYYLPSEMRDLSGNDRIKFIWKLSGADDGSYMNVYDVSFIDLTPVESDFTRTGQFLTFENNSGRGLITTRDFEAGELANSSLLSFDLSFDEVAENMTASQFLILEYSIDEGATYTELQSFPDEDAEMTLDNENFLITVSDDMKENSTRFRWRQEERDDILVVIDNVSFLSGKILPFDYVEDNQTITAQTILVTGLSATENCLNDEIMIDFEVRGQMGADNIVTARYREVGNTSNAGDFTVELNATSGTGQMTVTLPSTTFDDGDSNKSFRFGFEYDDDTDPDNMFEGTGPLSETNIKVVAPILTDTEFSIDSQSECNPEDILVTIDDLQNYFIYQFVNVATGENIGEALTYDPDVDIDFVNIGALTDPIELQLMITSASKSGALTCNTITSSYSDELIVNPVYTLHRSRNSGGTYVISSGETETVCDGSGSLILAAGRIPSNSNSTSYSSNVEWFRGSTATPVGSGITFNSFSQSGEYFGRVTDGDCVYQTEVITVTVLETPDRPVVTVDSGSLIFCEGEGEVVLSAPEGFRFYQWTNGGTTRTITVDEAGSYSVRVSNAPFDVSCGSDYSVDVVVEEVSSPEFVIRTSTSGTALNNVVDQGTELISCDTETIYFFEETSYANNGTVILYRDGVEYASTTSVNFQITESGVYSAEKVSNDLTITCVRTSGEFTVTINETPEGVPFLDYTGVLNFCTNQGNSVVLTAPAGFTVYNWYRNGSSISSNVDGFDATSNTLEVIENGTYSVRVGNATNCYGPVSNIVTVTTKATPGIPGVSQAEATCGPGPVTFVFNGDNLYSYQLINAETGLPSGDPVVGGDSFNSYITSAAVSEETAFYIEVSYADGSGCSTFNEFSQFNGSPNNVNLELQGNTLVAVISQFSNSAGEIRWYRNGVQLRSRLNDDEITITDGAEYMVEVDFEGAGLCTVTSNAIDLAGAAVVVDEVIDGIQGSAYPNPAIDNVNVKIEGGVMGDYEVSIMTLSGQVLMSKTLAKDVEDFEENMDIDSLQPGIYNLLIRKGKETKSMRIVKTQ